MCSPAFSLVTRQEFEEANPGVDYQRLDLTLDILMVNGADVEVLHKLVDRNYYNDHETYSYDIEEPDVVLEEPFVDLNEARHDTGDSISVLDILQTLDHDAESYELWSKPENRDRYPYAAEYEARYGLMPLAQMVILRLKYTQSPGGQETLRYYNAVKWLDEHGVGASW